MDAIPKQVHFPNAIEVSQRGEEFIYWAPERRVAVKVGKAGSLILEICRERTVVAEVITQFAQTLGFEAINVDRTVHKFLNRMIELRFLQDREAPAPLRQAQPISRFKPVVLYLHLEVRCNLSCTYCYNVEHRECSKKERALTTDEFLQLIEDAAELGVKQINFTGGEPLLSHNWEILARRARGLGLHTGLLTNGTLITGSNAAIIAEVFDNVIVSIDSAIPEEHDLQRGRGSHAKTVRGIQALRDTGYNNFSLRPVLTRYNIDNLYLYPDFAAKECGTTRILLAPYAPNSIEEESVLQLSAKAEHLHESIARFNSRLRELGNEPLDDERGEVKQARRCGAGSGIVSIDFNGDAYPCQAIHDSEMKMGNILETPLLMLGESQASLAFRTSDPSLIDICKSCNFNEICGGGCRAIAFSVFRSMTAHNPFVCEGNKAKAWDKIWQGLSTQPAGSSFDPGSLACQSGSCGAHGQ